MPAPRAASARLFLALWPPAPVREALQSLQSQWEWPPQAAPVPVERLHITLHFLGQVPLERAAEFREALQVPCEPFALPLDPGGCRVWPGGIAVLELAPPAQLLRLHAALGDAVRALDWPVEQRAYRPHVTFARRAFAARPPANAAPGLAQWHVDTGYCLVHSVPGRGYEVVHTYLCR